MRPAFWWRTPRQAPVGVIAAPVLLLATGLRAGVGPGAEPDPAPSSAEPAVATDPAPAAEPDPAGRRDADPGAVRECLVILNDGRLVRGLFVRRDDDGTVTVRVGGVETTFAASSVSDLQLLAPVRERYEQMRAAIDPEDVASRVALVEWLRDREMYDEALAEVDGVLELEPFHPQARRHKTWLEAQIELRDRKARPIRPARPDGAGDAGPDDAGPDGAAQARVRQRWAEFPLLTPDEVNLIRVYEVDLANPPRMRIERSTIEALLRDHGRHDAMPQTPGQRAALFDRPAAEILELMFRVKARELYGQVKVLEDPPAMQAFRQSIAGRAGWLVNACATVQCHGGQDAGRLTLVGRRANSDEALYTNFFILDQHRLADGTPLIDYAEPARSPLMHLGMRRDQSLYPHPKTDSDRDRWRAVFRDADDPRFRQAAEWIRSLYRPRPDYGIAWEPPAPTADDGDAVPEDLAAPVDRSAPAQGGPGAQTAPTPAADPGGNPGVDPATGSGPRDDADTAPARP
jgi:hypothetical protein